MAAIVRGDMGSQVYTILRDRIISLEAKPGAKLNIAALSRELDVSAIPIREALKRLTERKLVVYRPWLGYCTIEMSERDIEEVFAVRRLFECAALEEAIDRLPEDQLQAIREESECLLRLDWSSPAVVRRFHECDERLHHDVLIGSSRNRFLRDMYDHLSDFIAIARHLKQRIPGAIEEHIRLVDALLARDLERARYELARHLDLSSLRQEGGLRDDGLEHERRTGD